MKITSPHMIAAIMFLSVASCSEEKHVDVTSRLQEVNRLELARMTVGKVGMISDPALTEAVTLQDKANALYNSLKIGTRIGVYSYDTYIVAYVDLGKLTEEDIVIDREAGKATVTLPPVEIITDGREPLLHEEHSRVTGLRSAITPAERGALKSRMAREVKKEMASPDATRRLREAAEAKGRAWLSELLSNWGYTAEIRFRDE